MDILINETYVENFQEQPKRISMSFTETWSNAIDGVKLFEFMTCISKDIQLRYVNRKITLQFAKRKDWLITVIEILESCEKLNDTSTFVMKVGVFFFERFIETVYKKETNNEK